MDTCIQLLAEVGHLESLARRFNDEFPRLPKRDRNAGGAARMIVEKQLDVNMFGNLVVRLHQRHQQKLAKIKQASRIGDVTDTSLQVAIEGKPDSSDERRAHLEKLSVLDSPKVGTNIDLSRTYQQQNNFGLPAFEDTVTQLEDKMRALNPGTENFIDAEFETVDEREKQTA
jgi:hypothetical protein